MPGIANNTADQTVRMFDAAYWERRNEVTGEPTMPAAAYVDEDETPEPGLICKDGYKPNNKIKGTMKIDELGLPTQHLFIISLLGPYIQASKPKPNNYRQKRFILPNEGQTRRLYVDAPINQYRNLAYANGPMTITTNGNVGIGG